MVNCTICQKPIEKVPEWMTGVLTSFVCNPCQSKQNKNSAFQDLEVAAAKVEKKASKASAEEDEEMGEVEDEAEPNLDEIEA